MHHKPKHTEHEIAIDATDGDAAAAPLASPGAARRAADGHPRHHRREHRAAAHRDRPAPERLEHQLDDHELLADLRKPLAVRRPRRRPPRSPPHVPHRPRHLHRLLVRLGDGWKRRDAVRCSRGPGARRRDALPAALSIITAAFHGSASREGARRLGRSRRSRSGDRRHRRRRPHRVRRLADDLLRQSPRRGSAARRLAEGRSGRHAQAALARPRPCRGSPRDDEPRRDRLRDHAGGLRRLDFHPDAPLRHRRRSRASSAFAIYELHIDAPLLRVERIADRAVGGGLVLMLAAAGSIFGLFLLCSLYLQNVLGMGPAHRPVSPSSRSPSQPGSARTSPVTSIAKHGVRGPLAGAFAGRGGRDVPSLPRRRERQLPRRCAPGHARSPAWVSASRSCPSRWRSSPARAQDETGMISGLNSTGHEIGGTLGIAIFSTIAAGASGAILGPQAASGIGHAFLIAALVATLASLVAIAVLPRAQHFLAEAAAEPAGDARPLTDAEDEDKDQRVRPETPPGGRRAEHRRDRQRAPSKRWRAIPMSAWPRSLAAPASFARRSTCTSRHARRCSTPSWSTRPRRSRRDAGSRARPRRAEGSAGASAPRDLAATQPVPQRPGDQHQPALREGTAPPTPPDDDTTRPSARTRPSGGRLPRRCLRRRG